ncbi:M13 family metallopeptidase [Mesoterricola sediminis]|uniref:Peptidase M13 n=1 Tax=Mesoterricola sediminis TaxID=2927980 RepID=A0AA48GSW8_9BACT|nr:M13 family metallopeptidase [Mesoterricola sediminis]BDU76992.1 peptidase M13 [Mesoterricola sediminis]
MRSLRSLVPGLILLLAAAPAPAAAPGVDPALMDRGVKPWADFYRYANGAFDKEPIPADRASCGVNLEIDTRNRAILKEILEAAVQDTKAAAGTPTGRIGAFYRSGMDQAAIEKAGLVPLRPLLAAIQGVDGPRRLAEVLGRLHAQGVGAGFFFTVGQDEKASREHLPILGQGGLGLPEREFYFRDDEVTRGQRKAYVAHIARMLELAGISPKAAPGQAERILALETRLAKASRKLADLRDPEANYHKLTRAQLAAQAPGFPWAAYFAAVDLPAAQATLDVCQPDFFKGFAALARRAPASDWRAYLTFHLLSATAPYLPKAFEAEDFAFYGKTLTGSRELRPRWERVLAVVDRGIGEDLGRVYVQRAFPPEAKAKVQEIVRFHVEALRASIRRATWMGEATKAQALKKLDALNPKVGYPDVWRDYSAMALKDQPYVLNVQAAKAFEFRRLMAKLGRPVDRNEWAMTPQTNNAYYNPSLNEIVLPAGILQPPFFDLKADEASNYGLLSSTIGHELMHGLDDQGSQYDAEGNMRDWWTPEDRKAYTAQTEAVVRQYAAYEPFPGVHIDGRQTLGENLADIGGLKIAFDAWKLATAGRPQPVQAGLTAEQRFFVGFAQSWRTNVRPEMERTIVQSDVHCPERWRVKGSVAALPAFHAAFGTPAEARSATDAQFTLW